MPTYGRIEDFKFENNFEEYIERLEQYFDANETEDADKQRSIFLTVCGEKTYSLLRNLCAPDKPNTKSFDELKTTLTAHLKPKPLIIAERYRFHDRKQESHENVRDYLANLRKLADTCDFKGFLEEALRDRFVCGLYSKTIQRKLLSESELTLKKAFEIAVGMEVAERESNEFRSEVQYKSAGSTTHKVTDNFECYRCGKTGHRPDSCYYKNSKCHKCKEIGHLSRKCKKKTAPAYKEKKGKSKPPFSKFKAKSSKVHQVEDSENSENSENEDWTVYTVKTSDNREIKLTLNIEGIDFDMELDTGASLTLIGEDNYKQNFPKVKLKQSSVKLKTYTGDLIPVLGEIEVDVKYGDQSERLSLIVVKGNGPSLFGRNWLSKFRLDWSHIRSVSSHISIQEQVNELLKMDVFNDELGKVNGITASLKLKENATPKFYKPRPVPYALRDKIGDELKRLEELGILEKIKFSEWGAPIVPVMKPDGGVRICGDYKVTINPCLEVPQYPLPKCEDLFARLNGGEKFSKLDMSQAYQQLELNDYSKNLVAINTHLGLYRYTRLPFGAASSSAVFQECMDKILEGLNGVGCILDDLIITGKSDAEHVRNLELVLKRLSEYGIRLKKSKCALMKSEVEYFAFIVNKNGIQPSPKKVEAMLKVPEPENVKQLQSWLGLVNYYRKHIPDMSTVLQPLNDLLVKNAKWKWDDKCKSSFRKICELLSSAEVLAHYDPNLNVELAVDASPFGLGCVISHRYENGSERPIAYASRSLTSAERNYSQIEREALAIIFGVARFHQYLYGRKFTLITDNKPLSLLIGPNNGIPVMAASRLQRWAIQLSGYQYDVKCKSSKDNANADGLSRLPLKETKCDSPCNIFWQEVSQVHIKNLNDLPVSSANVKRETEKDKVLVKVLEATLYGWGCTNDISPEIQPYFRVKDELTVEEGCLLRGMRIVIPEKYRNVVLNELHTNHPGIVRMKSLARMHVWWPDIDIDIETTVRNCTACQVTQSAPAATTTNPWIWPSKPWQRIHIDFAGPFLGTMFLIVIDTHSKWMEVINMSSTTTERTICALRNLFAQHGLPIYLASDNGPQFTSNEFKEFLKKNGVKHILSAPYHPSSNGEAERAVRTFKQAMKTMKDEKGTLHEKIARFLLSYRTTPQSTTKRSPSELFVGRRLRTRLDILRPNLEDRMKQTRSPMKERRRNLDPGEPVLVRDYRDNNKWVRGVIVNRLGPVTYHVQVNNLCWKRHIDQIRDYVPIDCENAIKPSTSELKEAEIDNSLLMFPSNRNSAENKLQNEQKPVEKNVNDKNKKTDDVTLRRSIRNRKPTERLIEKI